ncbi:MAG: energy transducer TonB [Nitrospirae bacterium]|nr:energy transducer TonB [Nitrospirota bacterium]
MNYQRRGYGYSLVIHISLLCLIAGISSSLVHLNNPVVIDFSIENASPKSDLRTTPAAQNPQTKAVETAPLKPVPVVAKQEPVLQQETPVSETAAGSQVPVAPSRASSGVQPPAGSSSAAPDSAIAERKPSLSHGQASSAEGMKQNYLKEHFAYIRNIVQQKLSYPKIARKMGWAGKVIISFVVCTDGHAKDITIKEGSGIEMLDKNAIAAVQQASPFPRPPIEAQLIIPISYSLN